MKRIGILGYYGSPNLGDQAILVGLLIGISQVTREAEITVFADGDLSPIREFPNVRIATPRILRRYVSVVRELARLDCLLIGGGGLFHDYSRGVLIYYFIWALTAWLTRTPVVLFGVGVGPINTTLGRILLKIIVSISRAIVVRDTNSAKLTEQIAPGSPIYQGCDLTLFLLTERPPRKEQPRMQSPFTVTISVRPWYKGEMQERLESLVFNFIRSVVAELQKEYPEVRVQIVPFHATNDFLISTQLAAVIEGTIHTIYNVKEALEILSNSDLVIGMRLHSVLLGLICGAKVIGISYDPKVQAFMSSCGFSQCCISLDRIEESCKNAAALVKAALNQARPNLDEMLLDCKRLLDQCLSF